MARRRIDLLWIVSVVFGLVALALWLGIDRRHTDDVRTGCLYTDGTCRNTLAYRKNLVERPDWVCGVVCRGTDGGQLLGEDEAGNFRRCPRATP